MGHQLQPLCTVFPAPQRSAQQRWLFEIEGPARVRVGVGGGDPFERTARDGSDALHRLAVDGRETGAQRFVPRHQRVKRLLQRRFVECAVEPPAAHHLVERARPFPLLEEPCARLFAGTGFAIGRTRMRAQLRWRRRGRLHARTQCFEARAVQPPAACDRYAGQGVLSADITHDASPCAPPSRSACQRIDL